MQRIGLFLGLVFVLVGCGGSSSSRSASTSAPATSQAQPTFRTLDQGTTTAIVTSGSQVTIDNDADLTVMLSNHQGTQSPQVPAVDFSQERVVALFLGQRPTAGYSIEVVGVAQVTSDTTEVSYVTTRPSGAGAAVVTSPFHIVAIANTQGVVRFSDVTQAPTTTPLSDVHGTLVLEPMRAGGDTLAFLQDGATTAREITDPSALTSAGARVGSSLVLTGDAEANPSGATALRESVRIASFDLDDAQTTARLVQAPSGNVPVLSDVEGTRYEPIGPLASALLAQPQDRPMRITGRIDPAHTSTLGYAGLIVTSFREATTISIRIAGGLAGLDEQFSVDDLAQSGAARYSYSLMIQQSAGKKGHGAISTADRTGLESLVTAANLRSQPASFRPTGFVVFDVPNTTIDFADKDGDKRIFIQYGATLPPEVDALVKKLQDLRNVLARFRVAEGGSFSRVTQAGTQVARTAPELTTLWNAHSGGGVGATPPTVDFTKELVVAVFMGRQSSGGHSIAVTKLERIGDDLHVSVERRSPAPGTPVTAVITSPYQFVAIEHKGATGDLYVDGVKQ